MSTLQIEEESSHIQPASYFCKSPAGLQASSKVLVAVGNQYRKLLDECPEVMKPSKFVFLDPAAGQRKLNRYFQQFRQIRNYIGISKG